MDRGVWWATVHGIAKSQTQLSTHVRVHTHTHTHTDTHIYIHTPTLIFFIRVLMDTKHSSTPWLL